MKRILFLHNTLDTGGAEMMRLVLLRNVDRKRYDISLCCIGRKGAMGSEIERLGYPVDELREDPNSLNPAITSRLIGYLRKKSPDILHSSLFNSNFHSRIAGAISRVPCVITEEHGEHRQYNGFKFAPYIIADSILSHFCNFIVCCSEGLRSDIIRKERLPRGKVVSIKNCLDRGMYKIDIQKDEIRRRYGMSDEAVFICTASLKAGKGHEDLLRALAEIKDAGYRYRCFLAGEGPLRGALEEKSRSLDLAGEVIFLGNVDNIANYLNASDVFVLPSLSEGLSIALMEAMLMGLACIATDVGGNPDLVKTGINGTIVPPGDPRALAAAMIFYLKDRGLMEMFGRRSGSVAENNYCSATRYAEEFYELWDRCTGCKG